MSSRICQIAGSIRNRFFLPRCGVLTNLVKLRISRQIPINQSFTWNLKVIVERRGISIGDSIIWSFASFSFYASIRRTTPIIEISLNSPKIYESNFLVMNKRIISTWNLKAFDEFQNLPNLPVRFETDFFLPRCGVLTNLVKLQISRQIPINQSFTWN